MSCDSNIFIATIKGQNEHLGIDFAMLAISVFEIRRLFWFCSCKVNENKGSKGAVFIFVNLFSRVNS